MKDLSWLGDANMVKLGIHHTEDEAEVKQALGKRKVPPGPWIIIPYWDGSVRVRTSATNGHKYDSPHKSGTHLYVGFFGDDSSPGLRDKSKPLVIVEGEFCALAAQLCGLRAVGIAGCDGWVAGKGSKQLIPLLEALAEGSDVIVALDGDVVTNKNVARAQNQLGRALQDVGARVYIAPVIPDGRDLEDVLSAQGKEAAAALVALSACKRADYDLIEELSDRGLANRFVRAAGDRVRWANGCWMAVPVDGPAIWDDADRWFPEWALTLMHAFAKEHVGDPGDIGKAAERAVRTINGARSGRAILGLVKEAVTEKAPERFFDQRPDLWVFGDECLDSSQGQPVALTPELRITKQLPSLDGDKRHTCPVFKGLLEAGLPDDDEREALRLMLGAAFGEHRDLRAAVFLLGPPRSGKTEIMKAVRHAFGPHAMKVKAMLLGAGSGAERIQSEQTGACQAHMRMVWCDELESGRKLNGTFFKEATSGERTEIPCRPFGAATRVMPFRSMIFVSTNEMPEFEGGDEAIRDRLWVFEFGKVEGRKEILGLTAQLEAEAVGIRQWLLNASIDVEALRGAGKLVAKPKRVRDNVASVAVEADDVELWKRANLYTSHVDSDRRTWADLHRAFVRWLGGHTKMKAPEFAKRLRALLKREGVEVPGHATQVLGENRRARQIHGVILEETPEETQERRRAGGRYSTPELYSSTGSTGMFDSPREDNGDKQ